LKVFSRKARMPQMVRIPQINKPRTSRPAMAAMRKKIPWLTQVGHAGSFKKFNIWMTTNYSCAVVDEVASKEGMPAGFDPEVNNVVNDEVNKF
jgi:hypothetical protein